ncbi:MAG TPA: hypothetical protein VLU54_16830 [Casimicrobiaceae bacterium]|nr:hypothetical protein [Casimicrobiaceae bacterium]
MTVQLVTDPQAAFAVNGCDTVALLVTEVRKLVAGVIAQTPVGVDVASVQFTERLPCPSAETERLVGVQVRAPADETVGTSIQAEETAITAARLRIRSRCMGRALNYGGVPPVCEAKRAPFY